MKRETIKWILDGAIKLFWKLCPTLAERQHVSIQARVKYTHLRRNRPVNPEQIYDPNGDHAKAQDRQRREIERWKRNLDRYARLYEKTRIPLIDPPADEILRKP